MATPRYEHEYEALNVLHIAFIIYLQWRTHRKKIVRGNYDVTKRLPSSHRNGNGALHHGAILDAPKRKEQTRQGGNLPHHHRCITENVGNKLINEKRWAYLYARCSPTIIFLPTSLLAIVVHRRSVVAVFVEPCADAAGCRCCSCCSCPHAAVVVADRRWWVVVDLGVWNNPQISAIARFEIVVT